MSNDLGLFWSSASPAQGWSSGLCTLADPRTRSPTWRRRSRARGRSPSTSWGSTRSGNSGRRLSLMLLIQDELGLLEDEFDDLKDNFKVLKIASISKQTINVHFWDVRCWWGWGSQPDGGSACTKMSWIQRFRCQICRFKRFLRIDNMFSCKIKRIVAEVTIDQTHHSLSFNEYLTLISNNRRAQPSEENMIDAFGYNNILWISKDIAVSVILIRITLEK